MKKNPYLQEYHRTIVCDVDDTISSSTDHIWENAKPIQQTIDKINSLYDEGWIIILLTARGQLSCNGDSEAAEKKYRVRMETWLKVHGVKYHFLSFEKYLASYYIDDKSLTPEQFYDLDIRVIKSGWSGAKVEKRGNKIYKTHTDSIDAAKWYAKAEPIINTPKVYSVIGNTICLEYLQDSGRGFKIDELNGIINKFSMYKTYVPFETYIKRIEDHCKVNRDFFDIIPIMWKEKDYFNKFSTFMHGDLSLENVIDTDNGIFLIDPIYNTDSWSSFLLDITKMLHSYRKYNRMFEYEVFKNTWLRNKDMDIREDMLLLLEATQFIRVIKYCKIDDVKKDLIRVTHDLIDHVSSIFNDKRLSLTSLIEGLNCDSIFIGRKMLYAIENNAYFSYSDRNILSDNISSEKTILIGKVGKDENRDGILVYLDMDIDINDTNIYDDKMNVLVNVANTTRKNLLM